MGGREKSNLGILLLKMSPNERKGKKPRSHPNESLQLQQIRKRVFMSQVGGEKEEKKKKNWMTLLGAECRW